MDVFNSALRNPLPPLRKKYDRQKSGEAELPPIVLPVEVSNIEDDNGRRKKNSRRKHRNSHLGCGTCKKRRIKCDENLPQCFNCVKGKLHCAYLNLDAPARNALRMAQYNQNLRQDRSNDPGSKTSKETESGDELYKDAPPRSSAMPLEPQYYQGYAPYQLIPPHGAVIASSGHAPLTAAPGVITTSVSGAPSGMQTQPGIMAPSVDAAHNSGQFIQSPYGPVMLFQPVAGVPGYQPVAMQVMQGPQGPQMVYQSIETVPVQMAHQQVHMAPANIDGQPILLMQSGPMERHMSLDGSMGPQPGMVHAPVNAPGPQTLGAPPMGAPAVPGGYANPAGHYQASVPLPPPPQAAPISFSQPASAPTSAKEILPPIGALSNPSSLRTSPQLPVIRSILSSQLAGSFTELERNDIRLPLIRSDGPSTATSVAATPKVAEEVPSILKLLS